MSFFELKINSKRRFGLGSLFMNQKEQDFIIEISKLNTLQTRYQKFNLILSKNILDLTTLQSLCWLGIPPEIRPLVWKLLLGFISVIRLSTFGSRQANTSFGKKEKRVQGFCFSGF
jgi:hypothetical protein